MFAEDRQSHIRHSTLVLHEVQEQVFFFAVYLILQIITGLNTRINVGIGPPDKVH